jgi:hypothetical protein
MAMVWHIMEIIMVEEAMMGLMKMIWILQTTWILRGQRTLSCKAMGIV